MLLWCCLTHIRMVIMRQFFHLLYLCPSLQSRARNMGKIGKVKKEKGLTHSVPLVSFYTPWNRPVTWNGSNTSETPTNIQWAGTLQLPPTFADFKIWDLGPVEIRGFRWEIKYSNCRLVSSFLAKNSIL